VSHVALPEPLNLLSLGPRRVLVIARDAVYHYEFGKAEAERHAANDTKGPQWAWVDRDESKSFWARARGERSLRNYALASLAVDSGRAPSTPRPPDRVRELANFDSRLFALLADGTPVYSTSEGLRILRGDTPSPVRGAPRSAASLFGDAAGNRFWTADALGKLALWEGEAENDVSGAQVSGTVIDVARDGSRLAVLSLELNGHSYQPSVTVFSDGRQDALLHIGPTDASHGQPTLDLCLLPGRPWVVVAGKHWLQLLDFSAPRLLAEW
jgi:hypothetical protein